MDAADVPVLATGSALLVRLTPALRLSDDGFYELCRLDRELRIAEA